MDPTDRLPPASDEARDPGHPGAPRVRTPDELHKAIEQNAASIYRLALSIVRDPALADDVLQETMIKAWRSSPVSPDEPVPRSWLLKVARNTAISVLRTRREELHGPGSMPDGDAGPGTGRTVLGRAALDELWKVLERLEEDARTLIVLREIDGLSYDEIAASLDLPLPTVKTRLFRARRVLKDAMEEWR